MRRLFVLLLVAAVAGVMFIGGGAALADSDRHEEKSHHDTHHAEHEKSASGPNKLIEEMNILDGVFREVVSAVSLGQGERVYHSLHAMHGTKERTHEALHKGDVTIKKNAHLIKEFVKRDEDFHHGLEELAEAAKADNKDKMLDLTKDLLGQCVACHAKFR